MPLFIHPQPVNNRDTTRSESVTHDGLNRVTAAWSAGPQWGETFTIDAWGNLTHRDPVSGKTNYEGLNAAALSNNRLNASGYDAAGNMISNLGANFTYDAENRLLTAGGVTYTYDADGQRVKKSSGTLYWNGLGSETLSESDLAGAVQSEYIYFNGQRMARRDVPGSPTAKYYFSDELGSASVITNSTGVMPPLKESDYFPYGGEIPVSGSDPNHYKFTGKERDTESGLDNFGARFDASTLGRFMTPDWAAKPTTVPYANFGNPQSLNLYSYVQNNPTTVGDPDGHVPFGFGGFDACPDEKCQANKQQQWSAQWSANAQAAQNQANGAGQAHGAGQQGDVGAANHYLSRSKEMRLVQKAFKSGHFHLEIIHDGNDRYDPATRTVYWDPHSALETTEGGHQTPALGLGHEEAHATGNRHDNAILSGTPDARYDTKEERRVILNYENPAARELGESTRSNHGGVPYNVDCPTCQ